MTTSPTIILGLLVCVLMLLGWSIMTRKRRRAAMTDEDGYTPTAPTPILVSKEDREIFQRIKDHGVDSNYTDLTVQPVKTTSNVQQLSDIKNVVYINLKHRTDRRKQCESEFKRLKISAKRVEAIKCTPGSFGCTMSHIKCLEMAKAKKWDHVWINEDDLVFKLDRKQLEKHVADFFKSHSDWKVLMFHAIVIKGEKADHAVRVQTSWCTTSYLVHRQYYDVLLHNFYEGASRLYRDLSSRQNVDEFWKSLQKRDQWYLLHPIACQQRIGYSDIDQKPDKNLIDATKHYLSSIIKTIVESFSNH